MAVGSATNSMSGSIKLSLVIAPASGWLQRLDDMMGIVGCGFGTYTRQYE